MDDRERKFCKITGEYKMLGICSSCGNHEWDKEVEGNKIRCPKCGNEWTFEKLPMQEEPA